MGATVKTVSRPNGIKRQTYLWGVVSALGVTLRHLLWNFPLNLLGLRKKSGIATIAYPEEKKLYPPRNRGLH